jgi:surface polysaccharide O-acyltransferase-like enzyme
LKNNIERQKRLIGIDLFRGLAIFAVAIVHTDGGIQAIPTGWSRITDFALFAVPFFLALSFYLAIDKLYASRNPYPLRSRLIRLLIPYSIWSAVYLFYKVVKYVIGGESSRLLNLFSDPLSLVCFGGAAFHLYFLPLLAIGTVLVKFSEWAIAKKISVAGLALLGLVSLLSYEALLMSGNEYQIAINQAFQTLVASVLPTGNLNPLWRWILVVVACTIRCAPYIVLSTILTHPAANKFRLNLVDKYPLLWLVVFLGLNIFGAQFLPQSGYEIARGYSALLAAISVSHVLKDNSSIESLATCSFGIYLIHLFVIEFFQSLAKRVYPDYIYHTNTPILLLMAIVVVAISWAITSLLMRNKRLSRILF